MKRFLIVFLLAILPGCEWFSCCDNKCSNGAENALRAERAAFGFHEVSVSGNGTLHLVIGEKEGVEIEANAHTIDKVMVEVHDGTLHLYTRGGTCCSQDAPVTYHVFAKSVDKINASGAVKVNAPHVEAKDLVLQATGASSINGQVAVDNLTVRGAGSSSVTLSGNANTQHVEFMGTGVCDMLKLDSKEGDICADGEVRVSVNVHDKLTIEACGASIVEYKGSPTLGIRSSGQAIKNIQA